MKHKNKTWLKLKSVSAAFFIILSCEQSFAGKFDLMAGAYSLTAKTARSSGSASGLGEYHLNYGIPLSSEFDMNIGYTIIMSGIVGGDLTYGFDLGMSYFPFTSSSHTVGVSSTSYINVNPLWRPFVGVEFNQRGIQSVQSSYAGFSLTGGFERALDYSFDLKTLVRMTFLAGPNSATATEISFLVGITFP